MISFLLRYFWAGCLVAIYAYMWFDAIVKYIKKGDSSELQGMGAVTLIILFFVSVAYFIYMEVMG